MTPRKQQWANPATRAELEALVPAWEEIATQEPSAGNTLTLQRLKERLAEMAPDRQERSKMKGRELWSAKHGFGCRGNCPGCHVAWHHNLFRQFCHCGVPATGYRAMSVEADVEFFCDEHFQDVPAPASQEE